MRAAIRQKNHGVTMQPSLFRLIKSEIKSKRDVILLDEGSEEIVAFVGFCDKCQNMYTGCARRDGLEFLLRTCPTCKIERNDDRAIELLGEI